MPAVPGDALVLCERTVRHLPSPRWEAPYFFGFRRSDNAIDRRYPQPGDQ